MLTSAEIRKERLEALIEQHGSIAQLNEALGWPRTDPKLAQIRNGSMRSGRAKPYQMGDAMAREIEEKLQLERGWMDTPPGLEALADETGKKILSILSQIPAHERPKALRLLDALAEPPPPKAVNDH